MSSGATPTAVDQPAPGSTSTFPTNPSSGWDVFERTLRWVSVVVVFGVVVLALFGFAGLATGSATTEGDEFSVRVEYATVSRPGLATPLVIEVEATEGTLPAEVTVEIPRAYLAMFDENGLDPAPDAVTSDGTTEIWTFRPGDVATLSIDFDARLQPNMHYSRDGWVIVRGGDSDVRVDFRTRVMP
ncbi:MAG: hypothetical protein ABWZ99_10225 [Ilumatobacteraceae bacterium]